MKRGAQRESRILLNWCLSNKSAQFPRRFFRRNSWHNSHTDRLTSYQPWKLIFAVVPHIWCPFRWLGQGVSRLSGDNSTFFFCFFYLKYFPNSSKRPRLTIINSVVFERPPQSPVVHPLVRGYSHDFKGNSPESPGWWWLCACTEPCGYAQVE